MTVGFRPNTRSRDEAWVVVDDQETQLFVRYAPDGGMDLLDDKGEVALPNCSQEDVESYAVEWLEIQSRAHLSGIEAQKAFAGYVDPPAHLVPDRGPDFDPEAWDKLLAWFEARTKRPEAALLVAYCETFNCPVGQGYIGTDGFFKRKHQVDDDGTYCSYN